MAADNLNGLASRALGLWRIVRLFRDVGHRGIPGTAQTVTEQTTRILEALDPATKTISEINQPGYREKILSDTVATATEAAKSAIEKTSIVLAHSILDEVVTECCRISALLMRENWMGFVQDRKVVLSEVLSTPAVDIGRQMLENFVEQLSREPLLKRIDILNTKYQPAPAFNYNRDAYRFDRDRLTAIDLHRQRIIHQLELSRDKDDRTADDLLFLEATCFYLIFIVASKHGTAVDPMREALDALGSRSNSLQLAYERLLLATSLPSAQDPVWSFGGRVFATDNKRSWQLPLLMPAAWANSSADGQQIVFVRDRLRSGDPPSGDYRLYESHFTGDIWISGVDGSQAKCVLEGGPRPSLVTPVDTFAKQLEGITSPKFDPEAQLVYFIAYAWHTSGAIYVLDLKSGDVKFFTDGNAFVVLHTEPYRGALLVSKHRYYGPPNYGSYDHYWFVSRTGEVGEDCGPDFNAALVKLYGDEAGTLGTAKTRWA